MNLVNKIRTSISSSTPVQTSVNSITSDNDGFELLDPSPTKKRQADSLSSHQETFHQMRGSRRLDAVVTELSRSCPWTQGMEPSKMTQFLASECSELLSELKSISATPVSACHPTSAASIRSEIGDILFDAFMINNICAKKYGWETEDCFDCACEKVERRTPYVALWGDGIGGETVESCKKIWKGEKEKENSTSKINGSDNSGNGDNDNVVNSTKSLFLSHLLTWYSQALSFISEGLGLTPDEFILMAKTAIISSISTAAVMVVGGRRWAMEGGKEPAGGAACEIR